MASLMNTLCTVMSKVSFRGPVVQCFSAAAGRTSTPVIKNCSPSSHTLSPVVSICSSSRFCSSDSKKSYAPPSPYKRPGPRNYGYKNKLFAGGLLPRPEGEISEKVLKPYKPKDNWNRARALFGQNDYIDILGDGGVHPVHLIKGPEWLIGFKGNELQRLIRMLRIRGRYIKALYPTDYHNAIKRTRFLYKKYNQKRGKRIR